MTILIGRVGTITKGDEQNWKIAVVDDRGSTGGYYVFTYRGSGLGDGFDSWYVTLDEVEKHFLNLEVEWSDKSYPHGSS
jgi:hypothetical protein